MSKEDRPEQNDSTKGLICENRNALQQIQTPESFKFRMLILTFFNEMPDHISIKAMATELTSMKKKRKSHTLA